MYIYMYRQFTPAPICRHGYMYIYINTYIHTYIYICIDSLHLRQFVDMAIYIYRYIYKYVYLYIYIQRFHMRQFVDMPIHRYIHKYTYIYVYTYIVFTCANLSTWHDPQINGTVHSVENSQKSALQPYCIFNVPASCFWRI